MTDRDTEGGEELSDIEFGYAPVVGPDRLERDWYWFSEGRRDYEDFFSEEEESSFRNYGILGGFIGGHKYRVGSC